MQFKFFELDEKLMECVRSGQYGCFSEWRQIIKRVVMENELARWRASCMLYPNLQLYMESVKTISMHPWWVLCKEHPQVTTKTSHVMSVLMGCQPRGFQNNLVAFVAYVACLRGIIPLMYYLSVIH